MSQHELKCSCHIAEKCFVPENCGGLFIAAAVVYIYGQGYDHDFVSFDDGLYVYENPTVQRGLTLEGIAWAFRFHEIAYWHPLTWLSHMIDCEFFGVDAGGHHMTGLFIHLLNSLLLFWVLQKMTGKIGRSALVAAIFAVHPINVESVAWISERKNVLSTFFWLLTILAYVRFAGKPVLKRFWLVICFFLLGLMAKPMLITLPIILLLLDFWPLGRVQFNGRWLTGLEHQAFPESPYPKRPVPVLLWEKLPLMALSLGSIYLSIISASHHSIVISTDVVPLVLRIKNFLVSVVQYMLKLVWPAKLAVFYTYPDAIVWWHFTGALMIVLAVCLLALYCRSRYPYFIMGWLWFLITLFPVSGLIQGGLWPAMADRWAYVPFIGLFIIVAWGGCDILARKGLRNFFPVLSTAMVLILMEVAGAQSGHWKNSMTLFRHALDVTVDNDVAHNNLGAAYYEEGKIDQAIFHFVEAIRILPGYESAHNNLRKTLGERGKSLEGGLKKMIILFPDNPGLNYSLGNLYREEGRLLKAEEQYQLAIVQKPDFSLAIGNLAIVYSMMGEYEKALSLFRKKIELQPDDSGAYYLTSCIYAKQNRIDLSVKWLQKSVKKGFDDWVFMGGDPNLENIRHTPYYKELIGEKLGPHDG